ncbi:MAG: RluA family pseudouridine synthase [Gemmatimonadetes bacterium]|nr:RluA family pseudouridine synthase [Gemmatimonadota bacterium]
MSWTVEEAVATGSARLDRYLAKCLDVTRSQAARLIEEGFVRVGGAVARKADVPRAGARIEVFLPEPRPTDLLAEAIPLRLVYEDEDLAVVDKPAGLVVHPAPGHPSGTLVNALLYHVKGLSRVSRGLRPGIVHRLDRDTSGLLLVAKNARAHAVLSAALERREIRRTYLVACWGHVREPRFTVDAPVGRHPVDRKRTAVIASGRRAVTHVELVERWKAADFLRARLETGRTHQIRVHLKHIGHPVVGDPTYGSGGEKSFSGPLGRWAREFAARVPRQFLHAAALEFLHPTRGEWMRFESPLPEDLAAAAEWARQ